MNVDPFADLTYSVERSPALVFTTRITNNLLFTKNGKISADKPDAPIFIVGQSLGEPPVGEPQYFSKYRLQQIQEINSQSSKRLQKISRTKELTEAGA